MIQVFSTMYSFFENSKSEGSYFLLLAMSVFVLYNMNKTKNRWYMLYVVALVVLVVANPVTIWLLSLVFPAVARFSYITSVLPILIIIPFTATELLFSLKSVRERYILTVVLFIFVSICGNLFGTFSGDTVTKENYYDDEKKQIVEYLDDNDPRLVLADYYISPFISSFGENIPLLYGSDLWLADMDLGFMDIYGEEIYTIFTMMLNPESNMRDIATMGQQYDCDIIIVGNFENHNRVEGAYRLELETSDYLVYKMR